MSATSIFHQLQNGNHCLTPARDLRGATMRHSSTRASAFCPATVKRKYLHAWLRLWLSTKLFAMTMLVWHSILYCTYIMGDINIHVHLWCTVSALIYIVDTVAKQLYLSDTPVSNITVWLEEVSIRSTLSIDKVLRIRLQCLDCLKTFLRQATSMQLSLSPLFSFRKGEPYPMIPSLAIVTPAVFGGMSDKWSWAVPNPAIRTACASTCAEAKPDNTQLSSPGFKHSLVHCEEEGSTDKHPHPTDQGWSSEYSIDAPKLNDVHLPALRHIIQSAGSHVSKT